MSVAILKADEEVGYWEYSVLTEDGEWNLEFSRGEVADHSHTQRDDLHFLGVTIKKGGELFFSTQNYKDTPFLTEHNLNPMTAAASIHGLAHWYTASAKWHDIQRVKRTLMDALGGFVESVDFIPLGTSDIPPNEAEEYLLTDADCRKIGPFADETYRLHLALFDYGMVTTTPEWRVEFLGSENPTPSKWGHDEHE